MLSRVPLATIIITSYNYAAYVGRAIDSALAQTYPQVEVIVVDDGSRDGSAEIIAQYGNRIGSLLKANSGQASAWNAGFNLSHGDVICFLDSDDVLLPTAMEKAMCAFREGKMTVVIRSFRCMRRSRSVVSRWGSIIWPRSSGTKLPTPRMRPPETAVDFLGNRMSPIALSRMTSNSS